MLVYFLVGLLFSQNFWLKTASLSKKKAHGCGSVSKGSFSIETMSTSFNPSLTIYDVQPDALQRHFGQFGRTFASAALHAIRSAGRWEIGSLPQPLNRGDVVTIREFTGHSIPFLGAVSSAMVDDLNLLPFPSLDHIPEALRLRFPDTSRDARRFMEWRGANPARVAATLVSAGYDHRLGQIFPMLLNNHDENAHAEWAARDLGILVQMTNLRQSLGVGLPTNHEYAAHLQQQRTIDVVVPRALQSMNGAPLTTEVVFAYMSAAFAHWQTTARDFEEAGSDLPRPEEPYNPAHMRREDIPQHDVDVEIPTAVIFTAALNNLQALAWFVKASIGNSDLLVDYRYRVTLDVVTRRFKSQEDLMVDGHQAQGLQGYWSYGFFSIYETFSVHATADEIGTALINKIIAAIYTDGEMKYGDESDAMPMVRGLHILPIATATSYFRTPASLPNRLRFHSHLARPLPPQTLPSTLQHLNSHLDYPPDVMTEESELETVLHTTEWLQGWMRRARANAPRPTSLTPQLIDFIRSHEIKVGGEDKYMHQCLATALLWLVEAKERTEVYEQMVIHALEQSANPLLLPPFSEDDSFLPSHTVIARQQSYQARNAAFIKKKLLHIGSMEFRDGVQKRRAQVLSDPTLSGLFLRGNVLECCAYAFHICPALEPIHILFMRGSGSNVTTLLVEISLRAREMVNDEASSIPELLERMSTRTLPSVPTGVSSLVGILNGHAFVMSAETVRLLMRDVELVAYGKESVLHHIYNQRIAKLDTPYELRIPKPAQLAGHTMLADTHLYHAQGMLMPGKERTRIMSYDCETGSCHLCSTSHSNVIHPVMVVLGIHLGLRKCFRGVQCPRVATVGCMTQMILELQQLQDEHSPILLVAHFGARFDHWFLHKALQEYQIPYHTVLAGKKLQTLSFWNTRTIDSYNLTTASLDSASKSALKSARVREVLPAGFLSIGKYEAFPYALLDTRYAEQVITLDMLRTGNVWGDKRCDDTPQTRDLSLDEANTLYWQTHLGEFISAEGVVDFGHATAAYCEEDVRLLQIVTIQHYGLVCETALNGIIPDIRNCITAPSLAWKTFLTCFLNLQHLPYGRNRSQVVMRIHNPQGVIVEISPSKLLDMSVLGGYTYNNIRYLRATHGMLGLDINSSYPGQMRKPLPIRYKEFVVLPTPTLLTQLLVDKSVCETDLLVLQLVDFRSMTVRQRPFTVNFNGSNIGVDSLPDAWYDPLKKSLTINVRWVRECLPYLDYGAIFVVKAFLRYEAQPVFADFAEQLYAIRRKAKQEGDSMLDGLAKLLLNATFGKTLEDVHPNHIVVEDEDSLADMLKDGQQVLGITTSSVETYNAHAPTEPHQREILHFEISADRYSSGELASIGSCILAGARGALVELLFYLEFNFQDHDGQPLMSPQGDTDSIFILKPDLRESTQQEKWQECRDRFFSDSRLGAWKVEMDFEQGYILCPGKKTYCAVSVHPETLEHTPVKVASKGAPKALVKKAGIRFFGDMIQGLTSEIFMPTSFKLDKNLRMLKTSMLRVLTAKNETRLFQAGAPDVWSTHFSTLYDFLAHQTRLRGKTIDSIPLACSPDFIPGVSWLAELV
jgi:hypothetical protein